MESVNKSVFEQTTEIYIKKVLAGNIENVRLRVIYAIESLGYDIIEDEPNIIGRRAAKGWGAVSANILDSAMTLTIRLKPVSENSTRATFDYLVINHLFQGDKNVLLQEAKTIAAISKMQPLEKLCSVCETESTDDSKFCRKCGAPLTSEHAELEVLRMMAETRAGKASVVISSFLTSISAVAFIVLFLLNNAGLIKPKLFPILLVLAGLGMLVGMISSFFGWNRLKRALEKPETQEQHIPRHVPESLETGKTHELPPGKVSASVTEGTTNLLDEEWTNQHEKEKIPISNRRNTNNFD